MNKETRDWVTRMLEHGIIQIVNRVDKDMLEMVRYAISELYLQRVKNLVVTISSGGGESEVALEIYDLLRLYPGQVTGLVVGRAMSSAAIILQACTKRLATPNSRVLIHNGDCSIKVDVLMNPSRLKEFIRDHHRFEDLILKIMLKRTGRTKKEIGKECRRDEAMSAEQAIKFGLLDGIWDGPLPWSEEKEHSA